MVVTPVVERREVVDGMAAVRSSQRLECQGVGMWWTSIAT